MKMKKIPERRCIGCNTSFPKSELIRVVRTPEGNVEFDPTGKKNGRGAYLCKKAECFRMARKKNRLNTNLEVTVSEDVLDRIENEIAEYEKSSKQGDTVD